MSEQGMIVKIGEKHPVVSVISIVAGMSATIIFSIVGAVWVVANAHAELRHNQQELKTEQVALRYWLEDHEARMRAIEQQMGGITTDVRWIRQAIEKWERQ